MSLHTRTLRPFLIVVVGLFISETALSDTAYKWTNDNGIVQYTSKPPQDRPYTTIKSASSTRAESARDKNKALNDRLNTLRSERQERAVKQTEERNTVNNKRQACSDAKAKLANIQRRPRVMTKTESGEVRQISEKERQARIESTKKKIKTACSK